MGEKAAGLERQQIIERARALMVQALTLLDTLQIGHAAALLDHAICLLPIAEDLPTQKKHDGGA